MSILGKHLPFVNEQVIFHDKMVEKYKPSSFRGKLHIVTADKLRALATDLDAADKLLDASTTLAAGSSSPAPIEPPSDPLPPGLRKPYRLSLTIEEVAGLPQELKDELNLTDADKTEFAILEALEEAGGIITLDRLLIALFKKTGQVHKRTSLYSRLARMAGKSALYYVPGKKGVYTTEQLSSEDALRLFGTVKQDVETDATAS